MTSTTLVVVSAGMTAFRFRDCEGEDTAPGEWLHVWSARYPSNDYAEYDDLIARHKSFASEEFVRLGKWKDGVKTEGQWKPNVAMVAYTIWMQAATELPTCPTKAELRTFLDDWSGRIYTDNFETKSVQKQFGLSRTSTLLHFLSGGQYPIFDSRVRRAFKRLLNVSVPYTVHWYLNSCCPLTSEIALIGHAQNLRMVDMALFSYGSTILPFED